MLRPSITAPMIYHVPGIVVLGAQAKMFKQEARRVIANMPDHLVTSKLAP